MPMITEVIRTWDDCDGTENPPRVISDVKSKRAWIPMSGHIDPVLTRSAAKVIPRPNAATLSTMANEGSHMPPIVLSR